MNKIPFVLLVICSIFFNLTLSAREQIQRNRFDRPQSQPNFQSPSTTGSTSTDIQQLGGNYYRSPANVPTTTTPTPSSYYSPNYNSTFPTSPSNFNINNPSLPLQPQPQTVYPGQTSPYTQPGQYYNR